jgi:hypothetical protein
MYATYGKTPRQGLSQITKSESLVRQVPVNGVPENKMTWGAPIWFLFHTLAQKIKDESFPIIRVNLLNNIYSICSNLPCPVCSNHAIDYLNKINFNNIQSKDELIKTLYMFHNEVNKRKGVEMFSFIDVEKKYVTAITRNVLIHFMAEYEKKTKNVRMLSNEFHRKKLIIFLKQWFNDNMHHFKP